MLLFMLLFFVALFAILSARPNPGQVREGALLIDLDGIVVEEKSVLDPIETLLSGAAPVGEYRSRDIVRALDAAASDDRIKARHSSAGVGIWGRDHQLRTTHHGLVDVM